MPNQSEIEQLSAAYAAFNARDLDTALTLMKSDVYWPRVFKGGFIRGTEEVRAYWIEQGSDINAHVSHRFTFKDGRIQGMEIAPLSQSNLDA